MLASPAGPAGLPVGDDWVYEVKWDGVRVLADIGDGRLTLRSRTGRDITVAFPELAPLAQAHPDVLLDGEAVVLAPGGPSFARAVERVNVGDPRRAAQLARTCPVTLLVFDVLRLYGVDVTARPWTLRRDTLERLEAPTGPNGALWRLSPVYDDGTDLLAATGAQGLEGVVAKRRSARYSPGRRTGDWVKLAHRCSDTVVVGGWRPEVGTRRRLGALLVGIPQPQGLRYLGRVGSGLTAALATRLRQGLDPLEVPQSPFAEAVPREDGDLARWCRPELWVEVSHLGHGLPAPGSRLRAPVLRGIRPGVDLDPPQDPQGDA